MNLMEKWKELVGKVNSKGIPLPMARDPKTGLGSIAVSLLIVSGGLCAITILMMLATIVSKLSNAFSINENTMGMMREAFWSSLQFFGVTYAGYLGRKMQRDEKGNLSIDGETKN